MIFPRIRNLREDNDWTQTYLSMLLHIKQTTYSKYELGKITVPIDAFMRLAEIYGTSIDYLTGLTDERSPFPKPKKR